MGTKQVCGAWMPGARERCAVGAGHRRQHRTLEAVEADREAQRRRHATPEGREAQRLYNATPEVREAQRRADHLRRYGITPEDKAAILEAQGGCCSICKRTEPNGNGWHVDHYDDEDGRPVVRGVLCHSCNLGIGQLGDSPAVVKRALEYLLAHQPKEG